MKKKKLIIFAAGFLILIMSFGFSTLKNKDLDIVKNLDIYYTLFRELNMFYVDETDPEDLITTSIEAMLSSLDPYTTYIPESDMDDFQFQTTGEYGGIGSLIRRSGNQVMIAEPYDGFPAAKAGIRAGDVILEVDGTPTADMELESVSEKLKGKPGTDPPVPQGCLQEGPAHTATLIIEIVARTVLHKKTGIVIVTHVVKISRKDFPNADVFIVHIKLFIDHAEMIPFLNPEEIDGPGVDLRQGVGQVGV